MLKIHNMKKIYKLSKNNEIVALNNINITFEKKKFYGIIGHSGSGKSTLIQIIGLLDSYDSGNYIIDDVDVCNLSEDEKAKLRMKKFGFVFQSFYLNEKLTALENVIVPTLINKEIKPNLRKKFACELLTKVGLGDRLNHRPSQLSGGEQQRVAIARALVNNPEVIIADEPTGNLDKKNEKIIFDLFKKLVEEEGKTIILVSHNEIIKNYTDVIYSLDDGYLELVKNNET